MLGSGALDRLWKHVHRGMRSYLIVSVPPDSSLCSAHFPDHVLAAASFLIGVSLAGLVILDLDNARAAFI